MFSSVLVFLEVAQAFCARVCAGILAPLFCFEFWEEYGLDQRERRCLIGRRAAAADARLAHAGLLCPICLEDMGASDGASELSVRYCGHAFHGACLAEWTRRNPRCPVCRSVEPLPGCVGISQRRAAPPAPPPQGASDQHVEPPVASLRALEAVGAPHAWYIARMLRPDRTPHAPPPPVAFAAGPLPIPHGESRAAVHLPAPAAPYSWYVQSMLLSCGSATDHSRRGDELV